MQTVFTMKNYGSSFQRLPIKLTCHVLLISPGFLQLTAKIQNSSLENGITTLASETIEAVAIAIITAHHSLIIEISDSTGKQSSKFETVIRGNFPKLVLLIRYGHKAAAYNYCIALDLKPSPLNLSSEYTQCRMCHSVVRVLGKPL